MTENEEQLRGKATNMLRAGKVQEGLIAYSQLLALYPGNPDDWYNFGYLQRRDRQFEAALASYAQSLELGISRPEEVYLNRAVILSEHLYQITAAEKELHEALRINPDFLQGWLNLGNLFEDLGDAAAARKAYQTALAIAPASGRALARIAAIDIFESDAKASLAPLMTALQNPRIHKEDAAEITFALGHALDSLGDFDGAFKMFNIANHTSVALIPPERRYDPQAHEQLIDRIIAAYPAPSQPGKDSPANAPLFICGMFRSGSTLAEQILGRHSRVTAAGELDFIPALVNERLQPYPDAASALSGADIDDLRVTYLRSLHALHPSFDRITDKRPDNFLYLGLIKTLFPDAKIIVTRRQMIDNILSVYFLFFDLNVAYGFDLGSIIHWFQQYERLMGHWRRLYRDDIFDFDYDRAVAEPRPEIASLLDFCGLDWEDACLSSRATGSAVRTASVWQVRQPLHIKSSGRWKNYEPYLDEAVLALAKST